MRSWPACTPAARRPTWSRSAPSWTRRTALGDVGGAPFLHTLVASVPAVANADHYARRVRELATLRRVIDAGHWLIALGHEDHQDARREVGHQWPGSLEGLAARTAASGR